jgi:hypothetical protein
MKAFIKKHAASVTGVLSCFDRLIFKGHLPLGYPNAMEQLLSRKGVLFKDLGKFFTRHAEDVKSNAQAVAAASVRPYEYYNRAIRKEARAREIAECDHVAEGLICILATVEPCRSFRMVFGKGRPRIIGARRKCLFLYYYFMDPQLGLMHVRIQTWFPLTIQVYVNGHEWLRRRLDEQGIGYVQVENAFVELEDAERVQAIANEFVRLDWPALLDVFAGQVNPLLTSLLDGYHYYWATNQAEYATDIIFKNRAALSELYPRLLHHATVNFSAEDVLTFLGRKLAPNFKGEVLNEFKKRHPGARVRHWMKGNWIKLYDKHGSILRVETVINDPYEFKVRRRGRRHGEEVIDWFPLPRGVAWLPRYSEVSSAANVRYLDALTVVDDPSAAKRALDTLSRPAHAYGRPVRGFNPIAAEDTELFRAVMRGEHTVRGFRNSEIRTLLWPQLSTEDSKQDRRASARMSRLLKRLHLHGLIAKIPRSRRWRVTQAGYAVFALSIHLRDEYFPKGLMQTAYAT